MTEPDQCAFVYRGVSATGQSWQFVCGQSRHRHPLGFRGGTRHAFVPPKEEP